MNQTVSIIWQSGTGRYLHKRVSPDIAIEMMLQDGVINFAIFSASSAAHSYCRLMNEMRQRNLDTDDVCKSE